MKTAELTGAQLDYWVAKALDWTFERGEVDCSIFGTPLDLRIGYRDSNRVGYGVPNTSWSPSTDWSQGGLIIERERLTIGPHRRMIDGEFAVTDYFFADGVDDSGTRFGLAIGPTHLIAAMRAYVFSTFGDTVPDWVPA